MNISKGKEEILGHNQEKQVEVYQNPLPGHLLVHIVQENLLEEPMDLPEYRENYQRGGQLCFGNKEQGRNQSICNFLRELYSLYFQAFTP